VVSTLIHDDTGKIVCGNCDKCDESIIANVPYNGAPDWCPGYEALGKSCRIVLDAGEEKTMNLENVTSEVNEAMNVKEDPTNPSHYKSSTSLECIEAMEIIFGSNAVIDFCVCNAWKYIWRWKNKNGAEDLKKAKWYIERARKLIYYNDILSAKNRYMDILNRMRDYIDDIEREIKEKDED